MSTTVDGFVTHAPGFDAVIGDDARLDLLGAVDAHEGPVYVAEEDALYFTTLPRPGTDRAPLVQIKRLGLADPEPVTLLVADAHGANGTTLVSTSEVLCTAVRSPLHCCPKSSALGAGFSAAAQLAGGRPRGSASAVTQIPPCVHSRF